MIVDHPPRRGSALIWVVVLLPVLIGLCSLAVDWARVQLVKTELSRAADAAARHAAPAIGQGIAAVRARAKDAADDNAADGTPVVLVDSDVVQGNWSVSTKQFTLNGTPANAVRVTARRTGADAVPLIFARVLGKTHFDVQASAVVLYTAATPVGFVGLDGISFKNNSFIGSYNPNATTSPTQAGSTHKAKVLSNGVFESMNNTTIDGNIVIGPAGSVTGATVPTGTTTRQASPLAVPPDPAWAPGSNPLNLPATYTVNAPTTLPGGTYWFTSLTVNRDLSFSGPATVYVNGDIAVGNDSITAHNLLPSNLKIYQLGTGREFVAHNDFDFVGQVFAPGSDFTAKNTLSLRGTALFKTIDAKNNATIFLDEGSMAAGGASGGGVIALVR
jgi:Flp pilus assembly protein TadG